MKSHAWRRSPSPPPSASPASNPLAMPANLPSAHDSSARHQGQHKRTPDRSHDRHHDSRTTPAMPATSHPVRGKRGHVSVVLHKAELVALGIGHDDNYAPVVIVSFAGGPSSQAGNELNSLADIVGGHVKMDADLPCLRLGNRLEDQPRPGIAAMTQVDPAGRAGPGSRPSKALQKRATRCGSTQSMVTPDTKFATYTTLRSRPDVAAASKTSAMTSRSRQERIAVQLRTASRSSRA